MRFPPHLEERGSSERALNMQPYLDVMMMQLTADSPKQTSIYFIPFYRKGVYIEGYYMKYSHVTSKPT